MHDLHVDAGSRAELGGLGEGVEDAVRFVAQVGEVASPVSLQEVAEFDQFLTPGIRPGRREQARRQAQRPRRQGFGEQLFHVVELGRLGWPVLHVHGHQPERVVADQHGDVDRGRRITRRVLGERGLPEIEPRGARPQVAGQRLGLAGQGRRHREPAMADDLGGHSLAYLALGLGHEGQGEVGMGLDVDEAGRDDQAPGLDDACSARRDVVADGGDTPVPERHVRAVPRCPCAVDDQCALDEDVFGRCGWLGQPPGFLQSPADNVLCVFKALCSRPDASRRPCDAPASRRPPLLPGARTQGFENTQYIIGRTLKPVRGWRRAGGAAVPGRG